MQQQMKKVGLQMAILMGIVMSFFLALIGTLTSGHFTLPAFLISFLLSAIVSILIGLLIPVGRVTQAMDAKLNLTPGKLSTRICESLLSDLIYTPFMTLVMVGFAYTMAMKQSGGNAGLSFWPMYLRSLAICFAAGFVLIFIVTPLFLKLLIKKAQQ
jgi:hypothetical protein